jgi:2-oxoglutarate ferredoxin oxidoreductase subunit alpha
LAEGSLGEQNRKLTAKYKAMQAHARVETYKAEDADLVIVAYGSIGRIVKSAVRKLRGEGKAVGLVRPITLFPFPDKVLADLAAAGKRFLTIEHNCGQMVQDVRLAIRKHGDSEFFGHMPGSVPGTDDLIQPILDVLG